MDYLRNLTSTQHLLVAVVEALQSYSLTPKTGTSAADQTAEPVNESSDRHSDHQQTYQVPKGKFKTQIHPTSFIQKARYTNGGTHFFLVAGIKRAGELQSSDRDKMIILTRPVKDERGNFEESEVTTNPEENEGPDAALDLGTDFAKRPEERAKQFKATVESLKADLAGRSRPLTERSSMQEGLVSFGEELVAVYTQAKAMTEGQLRVAINAARIRYLDTLSLKMLEVLFKDDAEVDMIAMAIVHKKRTETS